MSIKIISGSVFILFYSIADLKAFNLVGISPPSFAGDGNLTVSGRENKNIDVYIVLHSIPNVF